ncbi:MAG: hypothetical protein FWG82_06770, partial [Oscillospiraceae bacterium]|nr:hypothetical protein [Oscillospiraceae bacterium]
PRCMRFFLALKYTFFCSRDKASSGFLSGFFRFSSVRLLLYNNAQLSISNDPQENFPEDIDTRNFHCIVCDENYTGVNDFASHGCFDDGLVCENCGSGYTNPISFAYHGCFDVGMLDEEEESEYEDYEDYEDTVFRDEDSIKKMPAIDAALLQAMKIPKAPEEDVGALYFHELRKKELYGTMTGDDFDEYYNNYSQPNTSAEITIDLTTGKITAADLENPKPSILDKKIYINTVTMGEYDYGWYADFVGKGEDDGGRYGYDPNDLLPFFARKNNLTGKVDILHRRPTGSVSHNDSLYILSDTEILFFYIRQQDDGTIISTLEKFSTKTGNFSAFLTEKASVKPASPDMNGFVINALCTYDNRAYIVMRSRENWNYTRELRAVNSDGSLYKTWKIEDDFTETGYRRGVVYDLNVRGNLLTNSFGSFSLEGDTVKRIGKPPEYGGDDVPGSRNGDYYYQEDYNAIYMHDEKTGKLLGLRIPMKKPLMTLLSDDEGNVLFVGATEKKGMKSYEALYITAANLAKAFEDGMVLYED